MEETSTEKLTKRERVWWATLLRAVERQVEILAVADEVRSAAEEMPIACRVEMLIRNHFPESLSEEEMAAVWSEAELAFNVLVHDERLKLGKEKEKPSEG